VVDQCPRVGRETAHCAPNVSVNLVDLLDRVGLDQRRRHALLDDEDGALLGLDADHRRAHLDGLHRVLNLEQTALGAERVDATVV